MPYTPPNYGTVNELGDARRRIWRVTVENPLNGIPQAIAHEEVANLVKTEEGAIVQRSTSVLGSELTAGASDPDRVVDLLHPVTDAVLGKTTIGAIHAHIYSLGRDMQAQRDIVETARIAAAEAEAAAQ